MAAGDSGEIEVGRLSPKQPERDLKKALSEPVADYLGQVLLNVDVRPIRAAYLVRNRNAADLRAAISEASTRWGGMQEPILPVSPKGRLRPWFRQLHDLLQPDILVEIAPLSDQARSRVTADLGKPPMSLAALRRDVGAGCHPLCAYSSAELAGLHLAIPGSASLVSLAAGGAVPAEDEPEWQRYGVSIGANASDLVIALQQLAWEPIPQTTPIGSTAYRCGEVLTKAPLGGAAVLWVSNPNSVRDVRDFWNLRALALRTSEHNPVAIVAPRVVHEARFVQSLSRVLLDKVHSEPDLYLCSYSVDEAGLTAVRVALGLQPFTGTKLSIQRSWPPRDRELATSPLTAVVNVDPRMHFVGERVPGIRQFVQAQLFRPETDIHFDHPVEFPPSLQHSGSIRLRLSGPRQLIAPPLPEVARLYHEHADWGHSELDPRGLEITVLIARTHRFSLRLPTSAEVLNASLTHRAVRFEPSSSGRYARGVRNRIPDIHVFRDLSVINVIRRLTRPRSPDLVRALERLIPQGAKPEDIAMALQEIVARQQDARTLSELRSLTGLTRARLAGVLERLLAADMATRGLRADCPVCQLRTFMPLPNAAQIPTCPGCGSQAGYASKTQDEPTLFYQLNTLLDQASANGVLGHLFGAAAVLAEHPDAYLVLGANLTNDGLQQETDLLGLYGRTLFAGEAKTSPEWFTPGQIAKDIGISVQIGATTHLMVCLEPLSDSTVDLARRECDDAGLDLKVVDPRRT